MEKKPYHHKDLKNALIEKGIELVSAEGVNTVSLRQVAAACGVSHAAPYSHFANKEDLLNAMQQYITEQFTALLEHTIRQYEADPELLLHMGKTYIMFFLDHPHYFSFLYLQSNIKINLCANACDTENFKPFVLFKNTVFSMPEFAGCSQQEKRDYVLALWACVHGIASIATMKNVSYDVCWEDKIVDLLQAFQHCNGTAL